MPGEADFTVRFEEDADTAVRVVGDQTLDIAGAAEDDFVVVGPNNTLETRSITDEDLPATITRDSELPTQLWIHPNDFRQASGSAAQTVERVGDAKGGIVAWLFDAAADEAIISQILMPYPWSTVDVLLWWGNVAASTGNVRWQLYYLGGLGVGEAITGAAQTAVVDAAPSSAARPKTTVLASGLTVVQNELVQVGLLRDADDATDTLANDASFFGLVLRKAS